MPITAADLFLAISTHKLFVVVAKTNLHAHVVRRKRKISRGRRPAPSVPRTRDDFFAKPEADQETWSKVLRTIAKMRTDRLSLSKAAKEAGVKSQTVVRWAGRAIKKQPNGRYSVSKTDSLLRVMRIPSNEGQQEVSLRNSKYGSTVGRYMDAVQKYLRTGDSSALKKFRGKKVKDANGNEIRLVTDLKELNRLGSAGVLSFESVYARSV